MRGLVFERALDSITFERAEEAIRFERPGPGQSTRPQLQTTYALGRAPLGRYPLGGGTYSRTGTRPLRFEDEPVRPSPYVHTITKGDTRPVIATIASNGEAVNLANITAIQLRMRQARSTGWKVDRAIDLSEVVDEAAGEIRITWLDADVDTAGNFWASFVITDEAGKPATYKYVLIVIEEPDNDG